MLIQTELNRVSVVETERVHVVKTQHKILSAFMACVLALTGVAWPQSVSAFAAESDDGIVLRLDATPSENDNPEEFYSGQSMQTQVTFKANLQDAKFRGAYLALTYSNPQYIDVNGVNPYVDVNTSEVFSRIEKTSNEVRLYFKEDTGTDAREASFPVISRFNLFTTPDKAESDETLSLKLADGTVVKSAPAVHFIAKAGNASYFYTVATQTDGKTVYAGGTTDGTTIDPARTADVTFTYDPTYYVYSSVDHYPLGYDGYLGLRVYDSIDVYQPLPEFAKFDAAKNPGWTYDAATNTAHYLMGPGDYNDQHSYNSISLKLTFPNASLGTNYTATSRMTFHLKNPGPKESDPTVEKSVRYRFALRGTVLDLPATKIFKKDSSDNTYAKITEVTNVPSRIAKGADWGFDITNSTQYDLTLDEVKDYKLDSRLQYASIQINGDANNLLDGYETARASNVIVRGLMSDGSTKDFGTVSTNSFFALNLGEDAKNISELYLVFPEGYKLPAHSKIPVTIHTTFREAPSVSTDSDENIFANSMHLEASGTGPDTEITYIADPEPAKFRLVEKKVNIGFEKYLSDKLSTGWFPRTSDDPLRADGQKAIWQLKNDWSETVTGVDDSEVLHNIEIVDVVSEGMTIVGKNYPGWGGQRPDSAQIYKNYNDSGLDAIVFHWDSITVGRLNSFMRNGGIEVITEVNSRSLPGYNYNYAFAKIGDQFITAKDENHMGSGFGKDEIVDERDINGNGDTTEKLAVSRASYTYSARSEVIARTYIARVNKDNFNFEGLKTGPGAEYRYKLFNYNNKQNMSTFELVDILPHEGDYQAAADAGAGAALARNSAFADVLSGPVTTNNDSKYTVYYSTDPISGKVDNPANTLTWNTEVSDYSQVTAIKVTLNNGYTFNKGEKLEAFVPMRAPENAALDTRAYNDFAISTNGTEWTPTNMVYNEIYVPSSDLTITKHNLKGEPVEGVEFSIKSTTDENAQPYTATTGADGTATITLPLGTYTVTETKVPDEYALNTTPQTVDIIEDESAALTFVNKYKPVDVTATKKWVGGPAYHPAIQIQLMRDGEAYGEPVTLENGTETYTWKGLEKTDDQGVEYTYTVDEVNTPENYTKSVDGLTVTNTYVSPKADVTATKTWVDGPAEHPAIQFQLMRDGVALGDPVTLENGVESYTWKLLDQTDANGVAYTYTVDEVSTPDNYVKTTDGLSVTNTYVIPKMEITATKTWVGGPAEHPAVQLQLFRDGEAYGESVILENGEETYTWTDLDKTDVNGAAYTYTVDEVAVPENYTKSVDGLTVTNTYVSPKTEITATKQWVDGPAEHPAVQLQLFRDGEIFGEPITLENGVETYTWTELNQTDANGVAYTYTVDEVNVPENYTKSIDGLTVTNTYVSPKTDITATKKWIGGPTEHPAIQLQLLRNDKPFGEAVTLESGAQSNTWTGLDQTDENGAAYMYTVDEVAVPENYTKSVDGLTITNTYVEPREEEHETPIEKAKNTPHSESTDKDTPDEQSSVPDTGDTTAPLPLLALVSMLSAAIVWVGYRARRAH